MIVLFGTSYMGFIQSGSCSSVLNQCISVWTSLLTATLSSHKSVIYRRSIVVTRLNPT